MREVIPDNLAPLSLKIRTTLDNNATSSGRILGERGVWIGGRLLDRR